MDAQRNISLRCPRRMVELLAEAGRRQCTKPSEYARQAIVQALRNDGFEPSTPAKEAV